MKTGWRKNSASHFFRGVSMRLPDSALSVNVLRLGARRAVPGKNSADAEGRGAGDQMINHAISSALVAEIACRPGLSLSCLAAETSVGG